jgi:hypothetical protein
MTALSRSDGRLEALYALALRLYPAAFRKQYTPPMRQAFRDGLHDSTVPRRSLIPLVFRDLLTSLAKEHLTMLRDAFARPALVFNALVLAGLTTVLALALYAIPQQVLRLGANDPQVALAGDLAAKLEQGVVAAEAVPAGAVDMARSLSPFVIAYDDKGHPLFSQGQLDGAIPIPPKGVFDFVRQHGEDRITWMPIRRVRIAAVVQRVNGAHPGFVLAGRSLREEEARQEQVGQMATAAWIAMLALIFVGTTAFGWFTRPKTA